MGVKLLKSQNRTHSNQCRPQEEDTQRQQAGPALLLTMLLSRRLNCANRTGEISSYLKEEKEVPAFL